jgi:hypothetical protein
MPQLAISQDLAGGNIRSNDFVQMHKRISGPLPPRCAVVAPSAVASRSMPFSPIQSSGEISQ